MVPDSSYWVRNVKCGQRRAVVTTSANAAPDYSEKEGKPPVTQSLKTALPSADTLRDRVALVTGASGGIGRAIALALAHRGARVAVGYGRNQRAAEEVADRIVESGGQVYAVGGNLETPDGPEAVVEEVKAQLGNINVLVSNAGRGEIYKLEDLTIEELDRTLAVNLRTPLLLAQRILPIMQEQRFGRVMFISSTAAFVGGIVGPHYAMSKPGLHGLTHSLAGRFAPYGITMNAIAPALIADTGMLPGTPEQLGAQIPVRRVGTPREVADLTLAVLENAYVTNQVISIDGGIHPR